MFCQGGRGRFGHPAISRLAKKQYTPNFLLKQAPLKHKLLKRPSRRTLTFRSMAKDGQFSGETKSDLLKWLATAGVNTSTYGQSSSKSVDLLWQEVQDGETVLISSSGRAVRHVNVVNVLITNRAGQILLEAEQLLPNGVVRPRNRPLSEKLLPGEPWQEGVVRGIIEELGTLLPATPEIAVDEASYEQVIEEKESQSYPGLFSRYTCHRVKASVVGLPDGRFATEELRADGKLTHIWTWQ